LANWNLPTHYPATALFGFNFQKTLFGSRRLDWKWELDSSSSKGLRHSSLLLYCLSTLFPQGIPFYVFSIWKLYNRSGKNRIIGILGINKKSKIT